jgi:hypothetical protein
VSSWYHLARYLFSCRCISSITYHRSIGKITDIQNNRQTAECIRPQVETQNIDPYMGFTEYLLEAFEGISDISMGITTKSISRDELHEHIDKLSVHDVDASPIFC